MCDIRFNHGRIGPLVHTVPPKISLKSTRLASTFHQNRQNELLELVELVSLDLIGAHKVDYRDVGGSRLLGANFCIMCFVDFVLIFIPMV